jgi:hypothetical protein
MSVKSMGQLYCSRKIAAGFLFFMLLTSFCFASVFSNVSCFVSGTSDKVVSTEVELVNIVNNATIPITITLNKDIILTKSFVIPDNKYITLTSNRDSGFFKLVGAKDVDTIIVEKGGVLRLDGIIVTHPPDVTGRGVSVNVGGVFFMVDGEISDNKSYDGCGVFNQGTFTMSGGKISGNNAYHYFYSRGGSHDSGIGGGVYNLGSFTMFGGKILGNKAQAGGGVVNYGNFTMSGGVISGNRAGVYSSVYEATDSTFNKTGGIIYSDADVIRVVICAILIIGVIGFLFLSFKKKKKKRGEKIDCAS